MQIGREAPRADSVPYDTPEQAIDGAVNYRKENSGRYLLLSQTNWTFRLFDSPSEFDRGGCVNFYQPDFDASDWANIFVPSVWQTQGYDHPIYTNTTQKFARNFGNKIWNAYRLVNGWTIDDALAQSENNRLAIEWFRQALAKTLRKVE